MTDVVSDSRLPGAIKESGVLQYAHWSNLTLKTALEMSPSTRSMTTSTLSVGASAQIIVVPGAHVRTGTVSPGAGLIDARTISPLTTGRGATVGGGVGRVGVDA